MWAFVTNLFRWSATWWLRSLVFTFVIKSGLFVGLTVAFAYLLPLIGDVSGFSLLYNTLPDDVVYFLNLAAFPQGVSIVCSAYSTRFFIRRLPFIG